MLHDFNDTLVLLCIESLDHVLLEHLPAAVWRDGVDNVHQCCIEYRQAQSLQRYRNLLFLLGDSLILCTRNLAEQCRRHLTA